MVPKVTAGASLRSALDYDFDGPKGKSREPKGIWICGSLAGTAREMSKQASSFRALRPDIKKAIFRCSLSADPRDGFLSETKWEAITSDFLKEMGIDPKKTAWVGIRHADHNKAGDPHDHVHLSVCRIQGDGLLWNQEHSAKRAIKACQKIEQMHHLHTHSHDPPVKVKPTVAEIEISNRTGKIMTREFIQKQVDIAIKSNSTISFEQLKNELAVHGIEIEAYAPGGIFKGVSYTHDGFKWPGSKVGRGYSAGLIERGVSYNVTQAPAATSSPRREPPKVLKRLAEMHQSANKLRPLVAYQPEENQPPKPIFDLETNIISRAGGGPLSQAMLYLGAALINSAQLVILAVYDFLKRLLARFGIGMAPTPVLQKYERLDQPRLAYQPIFTPADAPKPDQSATETEHDLAAIVSQLTEAVQKNDASLLPDLLPDDAEKIADAMAEAEASTGKAEITQVPDELDSMFDTVAFAAPAPATQPEPDLARRLLEAGKSFRVANFDLGVARLKPISPEERIGVEKLVEVIKNLKATQKKLAEDLHWKQKQNPIVSKFWIFPEKVAVEKCERAISMAEQKRDRAMLVLREVVSKAPEPKVPESLIADNAEKLLIFRELQKLVLSKSVDFADSLSGNARAETLAKIQKIKDGFLLFEHSRNLVYLATAMKSIANLNVQIDNVGDVYVDGGGGGAPPAAAPPPVDEEDDSEEERPAPNPDEIPRG